MPKVLTSRERVLRSFHHQEPDRVPIHCLQDNSHIENVVAMYDAAHECGRYGFRG
jgi:hypothetical protein